MKKSGKLERILLRLQVLTLCGIPVAQILELTTLASALFTLTFLLTVGLWMGAVNRRLRHSNALVILILLLSALAVTGNALMTGTAVSPAYFKKLIMFWMTILLLGAMTEFSPSREDVRFTLNCSGVLSLFLVGMYLLRRPQMHLLNGIVTGYLTFHFTNPNLTAGFLGALCMLQLIHASWETGWKRWVHLFLGAGMLLFVIRTRARNGLLSVLFFLLFWLFGRRSRRLSGLAAAGITMLPLLFAVGYLLLVESAEAAELFSFLTSEGKDLDSRAGIWRFALEAVSASPILGDYSGISGGTGASQMHNSHLDILASYGGVVFLLVWLFLTAVLAGEQGTGRVHFLCQAALGAMLLSGTGEAMLFSGGMSIYIFAGLLRMLMNFDFEGTETA